jgi:adenine-specific DNA-methyltransferase
MIKFDEKYNSENFLHFLKDFLPEDFKEAEKDIILEKGKHKKITAVKELGFSESLDLYVLEIEHDSETDPRITIATESFKILAQYWMHRALVVFKNKEAKNYRLSYLTISLDINDKNKTVKKYSNARRYSFYLGEHAKIKTPEQQLIKKGRVKDVEDLLSRFSVEVVNKQFYLEVAKYFDELVSNELKNLVLPSVSQTDSNIRKSFAVRLIGRIMFCWFLKQKKSSFGQLIPNELLSSAVVSDNYYHSILEPLFFGVLNTSIESRDIRSDLFDKVPYLNGGLFNPQTDDFYELDRGTFTSKYTYILKINDSWFKGFFELLETYNFTIDENTVFDQELSVDPEMLGRIFENLLAEINPETGSSERKRTGSFYTPRQIVEYMVDQSLIEYFKTKTKLDEQKISALVSYDLADDAEYPLEDSEKLEIINAIETLKILDPACGSGAYPIGVLQKIVYILQQIDPDCKLWLEQKLKGVPELYKQKIINEVKENPFDYTRKLDVIKNSIFGVDIQPIAVDVARLRCFLTLVVESEIIDTKPNRGIEPLPNLDFKFVCANTLIGLPKAEKNSLFDDHSGIVELSKIMTEYFTCNSQRKNEIKLKFINLQKEMLEKTVSAFGRNTGDLTLKLTTWNPFSNDSNSWFDPEWMFGLEEKFDVVIANPPYGATLSKIDQEMFTKIYKSAIYKVDTYGIFIEQGINLLKDFGVITYIVPYTWTTLKQFTALREMLLENNIKFIIDLPVKIFASADLDTTVFLLKKERVGSQKIQICEINEGKVEIKRTISSFFFKGSVNHQINLNLSEDDIRIVSKVNNSKSTIKDFFQVSQGLIPYDKYRGHTEEQIKNRVWHSNEKKDLNYKIELRGENVSRYYLNKDSGLYIKYGKQLAAPREDKFFLSPRVLIREITRNAIFATYTEEELYNTPVIINVISKDEQKELLFLLLGLVNSSLFYYIHKKQNSKANAQKSIPKILVDEVRNMPFFNPNQIKTLQSKEIIKKVKENLAIKNQDHTENTEDLEKEIDELVLDLYMLGKEERKIIKNS